jgi:hypothetical protein
MGVNWGAFLLSVLWAISNQVWIGLLCLIPYLGIIMCFVLLFKGNELAWKSGRQWDSIEQFQDVQRAWARWGVGITICFVSIICFVYLLLVAVVSVGRGY